MAHTSGNQPRLRCHMPRLQVDNQGWHSSGTRSLHSLRPAEAHLHNQVGAASTVHDGSIPSSHLDLTPALAAWRMLWQAARRVWQRRRASILLWLKQRQHHLLCLVLLWHYCN